MLKLGQIATSWLLGPQQVGWFCSHVLYVISFEGCSHMLYFVKCRSSQNRPSCWAPYDLRCRCALKPNQTTKLGQNVCLNEPRSSSDIGYMASKTRSLDQVKGKPCEHYRSVSTSFSPNLVRMFVSMRSKQCSNTDHIG